MEIVIPKNCPFCQATANGASTRILAENEHAFLIKDAYPVTEGHSLVVTKRHIGSFFETTSGSNRSSSPYSPNSSLHD